MKKAIYISNDSAARIRSVYSPETREAISGLADIGEGVYSSADLGDPALSAAEIALSTWGMPKLSEEEIGAYLPNLKILFYAAGSVQEFARTFLRRGVRIVSAWAANAVPVAEYAFSQIILANKGFFQSAGLFKEQGYRQSAEFSGTFPGTFGCTIGIIGAGMVGRKVIEMLNACGVRARILVFDPFLPEDAARSLGVEKCSLDILFAESQTISNHLANNDQTRGILHYDLFKLMKPNAAFINTGRGAQVVEADLARALRECPSRTALLDVTYPEPPEAGHPFYELPNVFLTPHIAGSMGGETYRMGEYILDELRRYVNSEPLRYEVTMGMLETMA